MDNMTMFISEFNAQNLIWWTGHFAIYVRWLFGWRYISRLHLADESQKERSSCPPLRSCSIGSCHVGVLKRFSCSISLALPLALKSPISKLKNRLKCCLRVSQGKISIYSARWSLHLFIAFVKERFHNAVKIDILEIFGRVIIVTNLLPTPPKNHSGAVASLSFHRPRFNAYTHGEAENSSIVQIERSQINMRSSSYSSSEENRPVYVYTKTKTQSECRLRLYGRTDCPQANFVGMRDNADGAFLLHD